MPIQGVYQVSFIVVFRYFSLRQSNGPTTEQQMLPCPAPRSGVRLRKLTNIGCFIVWFQYIFRINIHNSLPTFGWVWRDLLSWLSNPPQTRPRLGLFRVEFSLVLQQKSLICCGFFSNEEWVLLFPVGTGERADCPWAGWYLLLVPGTTQHNHGRLHPRLSEWNRRFSRNMQLLKRKQNILCYNVKKHDCLVQFV